MIATNRQRIESGLMNHVDNKHQAVIFTTIFILIGLFMVSVGLNVFASGYTYQVVDELEVCRGYLLEFEQRDVATLDTGYCQLNQPYVVGYSLEVARSDTRALREMIQNSDDEFRERRRTLIEEQKQLIQRLEEYGTEYDIYIPQRDDDLLDQINDLQSQNDQLAAELESLETQVNTKYTMYRYFVFEQKEADPERLADSPNNFRQNFNLGNQRVDGWLIRYSLNGNEAFMQSRMFSPSEFVSYADSKEWQVPKSQKLYVTITGETQIDTTIIDIAWERGYRPRISAEENNLVAIDSQRLAPQAHTAWLEMKAAAARDGVGLNLTSGYRSVEFQQELFRLRLKDAAFSTIGRELSPADLGSSVGLEIINKTLELTAPPGYSKHHTGYTIDLGYEFASGSRPVGFADTLGFQWLSANNYYNAKRFGFMPSYPEDADFLGPEPEAWEYVWVGEIK